MKLVIYVGGDPLANGYVARAYNDETDEHLWSSEGALSLHQALNEVATGIEHMAARSAPTQRAEPDHRKEPRDE